MSFYELLYQNETLYQVSESVQGEALPVIEEVIAKPVEVVKIELSKPIPKPAVQPVVLASVQPIVVASPRQHDSVLILVDEFSPSDGVYLDKILKAAGGMSIESVDLQIFKKSMDFRPMLRSGRIKHFVSFGVPFLKVNVDLMMNRYEPKILGGIVFVFADSLPVVEADESIRRALWGVLKALFVK